MTRSSHQKVTASHLRRDAYLYVRQSTVRQVFENTESTRRQYGLRERAVALGWPVERVHVIDSDLGKSGASTADREGFQKLVGEVGMGRAGIVLGLEVSRLARNSTDWHRLLEICALTDTLILDEDGIYSPAEFNDRLLLGLKGTMSDAELHVLRARLRGGILNQARRGALKTPLPVGLVYDPANNVMLDPDSQVRQSLAYLFETFDRMGSASATVRHFREQDLRFPRRPRSGPHKGELLWAPLYTIGTYCGCSTTRVMPVFSVSAAAVRTNALVITSRSRCSRVTNGSHSCPTLTPATSRGNNLSVTSPGCVIMPKPRVRSAARVRLARDRRCSRG